MRYQIRPSGPGKFITCPISKRISPFRFEDPNLPYSVQYLAPTEQILLGHAFYCASEHYLVRSSGRQCKLLARAESGRNKILARNVHRPTFSVRPIRAGLPVKYILMLSKPSINYLLKKIGAYEHTSEKPNKSLTQCMKESLYNKTELGNCIYHLAG